MILTISKNKFPVLYFYISNKWYCNRDGVCSRGSIQSGMTTEQYIEHLKETKL